MSQTFTVSKTVTEDFIDHNNHMHDAYYNITVSYTHLTLPTTPYV